jgi:hypothetical protein
MDDGTTGTLAGHDRHARARKRIHDTQPNATQLARSSVIAIMVHARSACAQTCSDGSAGQRPTLDRDYTRLSGAEAGNVVVAATESSHRNASWSDIDAEVERARIAHRESQPLFVLCGANISPMRGNAVQRLQIRARSRPDA